MDSLDNLPEAKTVLSPKEEASLARLFQDEPSGAPPAPPSSNTKLALACLVGLFAVLANPWTTGVFEAIPKCEGKVAQLSIKTLVFLIVAYIILQWIM